MTTSTFQYSSLSLLTQASSGTAQVPRRAEGGAQHHQSLSEHFSRVEEGQGIRFIEVREHLTAPIVEATKAPAILVISNLNSNEYIEDLSPTELAAFDCVYLYTYMYHNFDQAFKPLEQYVAGGGSLIIDTGFESPESGSTRLPGFFPVNETARSPLGKEWNFKVSKSSVTQGIDFSAFSPPVHVGYGGEEPWTHSYAPSDRNVKPWASVVLWNHHSFQRTNTIFAGGRAWRLPYRRH